MTVALNRMTLKRYELFSEHEVLLNLCYITKLNTRLFAGQVRGILAYKSNAESHKRNVFNPTVIREGIF